MMLMEKFSWIWVIFSVFFAISGSAVTSNSPNERNQFPESKEKRYYFDSGVLDDNQNDLDHLRSLEEDAASEPTEINYSPIWPVSPPIMIYDPLNTSVNSTVGHIIATDPNIDDRLQYSFNSTNDDNDDKWNSLFAFDNDDVYFGYEDNLSFSEFEESTHEMWIISEYGAIFLLDTMAETIISEFYFNVDWRQMDVDSAGNAWIIGARKLVKIGLNSRGQCVDKNEDDRINTSSGEDDVKGWIDFDSPDDECVLQHYTLDFSHAKSIALIDDDHAIIGTFNEYHYLVDLNDGSSVLMFDIGCGGSESMLKHDGILWSIGNGGLLRYDLSTNDFSTAHCVCDEKGYKITVNGNGNVYTGHNKVIKKWNRGGSLIWTKNYSANGISTNIQGLYAKDNDDDTLVAVAYSNMKIIIVSQNNGTFLNSIPFQPHAVIPDYNMKLWALGNQDGYLNLNEDSTTWDASSLTIPTSLTFSNELYDGNMVNHINPVGYHRFQSGNNTIWSNMQIQSCSESDISKDVGLMCQRK
eukprot:TRINITY_DN1402_c0_g2_i7.p1 TRINITY_DN1402_c0_g2~~TRINITY_DN1402_c0_g2_i7.p1  ORF type:complete len:524 (+),score=146.12 TRINITY_DN1402_c0_g2_i7:103-1674(+)